MTKKFDEQLSAYMDGELAGSEHEQMTKQLVKDSELKQCWHRYHIISDAMRNKLPNAINPDLFNSISSRINSEPPILAPANTSHTRIVAPIATKAAGIAIAASVAIATVVSVQMFTTDPETKPQLAEMPDSSEYVRLTPKSTTANAGIPLNSIPANTATYNPRLNKYLVDHNQTVTRTHVQGVMPYARIMVSPPDNGQAK